MQVDQPPAGEPHSQHASNASNPPRRAPNRARKAHTHLDLMGTLTSISWAPMPMATRLPRPLRAMRKHVLPPSQQKPPPTAQRTQAMATRTRVTRRMLTLRRGRPLRRGGPPPRQGRPPPRQGRPPRRRGRPPPRRAPHLPPVQPAQHQLPPAQPAQHQLPPAPHLLPPCCLLPGEEAEAEAGVGAEPEAGPGGAAVAETVQCTVV